MPQPVAPSSQLSWSQGSVDHDAFIKGQRQEVMSIKNTSLYRRVPTVGSIFLLSNRFAIFRIGAVTSWIQDGRNRYGHLDFLFVLIPFH